MKTKLQNQDFYQARALWVLELKSCDIELQQLMSAGYWPERQLANLARQAVLKKKIRQTTEKTKPQVARNSLNTMAL